MNEKLKELAKSAGASVVTRCYGHGDYRDVFSLEGEDNIESFAKLIIQECSTSAWFHFMDTCKKSHLAPAEYEKWMSCEAIKSNFEFI